MNNPKINSIIDRLYERNNVNINEGFIKDVKTLMSYAREFEKFLNKKRFYVEDIGVDNGKILAVVQGDWKHEHIAFKQLAREFFKSKGHEVAMGEVVTHEDGSDTYTADHFIAIQESAEVFHDSKVSADDTSTEEPFNAFMEEMENLLPESLISKMDYMLKKFSKTELNDTTMTKIEPNSGFDFFIGNKLIVFVLPEGMSENDENPGVVAVLTLPKGRIHIIDTEITDNEYLKNTVLYNLHELELMSKEVWIGDIEVEE